ncbi:hypothetical protein [Shumkonia mesophila]|uniref:hypothetical protein n=1 Tax=Shumkonia mesophila TaxID=2838854 RepID=UPI00293487A8|nr:hypothetical protein [Shumkonia mesophila]
MINALAFASQVLQLLPAVISGVKGASQAMTWGAGLVKGMAAENRDPTPAEWDALNAMTAAFGEQLLSDD